jgi:hypothetical protein
VLPLWNGYFAPAKSRFASAAEKVLEAWSRGCRFVLDANTELACHRMPEHCGRGLLRGGCGTPINFADLKLAIEKRGVLTGTLTLFQINAVSICLPEALSESSNFGGAKYWTVSRALALKHCPLGLLRKVPFRMASIKEITDHYVSEPMPPRFWPRQLHLVISTTEAPAFYEKLDGDELIPAVLRKFANLICECADEVILSAWAKFLLRVPVQVEYMTEPNLIYMRKRQLREDLVSTF